MLNNIKPLKHKKNFAKKIALEFLLFVIFKIALELFLVIYFIIYNIELEILIHKVVVGWLLYLIIVYVAIKRLKDFYYSVGFKFLFILGGISTFAIYELENIETLSFIKAATYWVLLLVAFIRIQKISQKKQKSIRVSKIPYLQHILLLFAFVFAILMSGIYAGFRFTISFEEIYNYRLEMRAAGMPTIVRYLFTFIGGVILPYCFAYFLSSKSYILSGIALLSGILIFSINGMKTWLLVYLLIAGVFISFKLNKEKLIIYVLLAMCLWVGLSLFLFQKNGDINLLALLGRTEYIPSKIGYKYIAFFDENEFLFLRESILKYFFEAPYPVNSAFFIVEGSLADINTSRANNGLWGDAYANFAIFGLFIYPFIFAYIIKLLKYSMIGQDIRLLISITFILIWSAVNISFFTWLITGGVIMFLIINKYVTKPKNINQQYITE